MGGRLDGEVAESLQERLERELAPRLNACGRMGHAREAVHMLTDAPPAEAAAIAANLTALNRRRQSTERTIFEQAARIRDELARTRSLLREQFELQFAPELAGHKPAHREAVSSAGDLLTQLESIDYLRRHRQLSLAEARTVLVAGLAALLA